MSSNKDRLRALGGGLRRGYALADQISDCQFEELLHQLAHIPPAQNKENSKRVD